MYGGGAPANFADISNSSALETLVFSDKAPAWRKACAGLNVEGRCANRCCQAYRHMVIDPKGMVSWSLIAGQAHCPMCHKQFPPVTCAFSECSWAFDGCKLGSTGQLQHAQAIIRLYQQTSIIASRSMTIKQTGKCLCCLPSRARLVQAFAQSVGSTLMTATYRPHHVATLFTAHALTLGSESSRMQVAPCVEATCKHQCRCMLVCSTAIKCTSPCHHKRCAYSHECSLLMMQM